MAGDEITKMAIRKMDSSDNFLYDYEINCTEINNPLVYPPCPSNPNVHARNTPICWTGNMSCTPGTWVRAEVGTSGTAQAPKTDPSYIHPTETYKWKVIGVPVPPHAPARAHPPVLARGGRRRSCRPFRPFSLPPRAFAGGALFPSLRLSLPPLWSPMVTLPTFATLAQPKTKTTSTAGWGQTEGVTTATTRSRARGVQSRLSPKARTHQVII